MFVVHQGSGMSDTRILLKAIRRCQALNYGPVRQVNLPAVSIFE